MKPHTFDKFCLGLLLTVAFPNLTLAQGWNDSTTSSSNWTVPENANQQWGGNKNDLDPTQSSGPAKTQPNSLKGAIPKTRVANPFDASGVYMGETQVRSGTGVDTASGMTVPDAPAVK